MTKIVDRLVFADCLSRKPDVGVGMEAVLVGCVAEESLAFSFPDAIFDLFFSFELLRLGSLLSFLGLIQD